MRPPDTNRGVYPLTADASQLIDSARFDAFNATVFENPFFLVDELQFALESVGYQVDRVKLGHPPSRWYSDAIMLNDDKGKKLVGVLYGGRNGRPLVQTGLGCAAPIVADAVRRMDGHNGVRLDSAIDARFAGGWPAIVRWTKRIARQFGLSWRPDGDWVTPDAGRTIYLGSRRSQLSLRIYEKGLEQAAKLGLPITDELRFHIRCEVEFKPDNPAAKQVFRTITPAACWGLADWLVEFARLAFSAEAERVNVSYRRESDHERALRFMAGQYSRHLEALVNRHHGDLAGAMEELLQLAGLMPRIAA